MSPSLLKGATLLALVVAALSGAPVVAHGGLGPSLEVVPNRVEPGESVSVVGEDLEPFSSVRVDLLTAAGDQPLIEVRADEAGHITATFAVPDELRPRVYELRGTAGAAGVVASTYLTVLRAGTPGEMASWPLDAFGGLMVGAVVMAAVLGLIILRLAAGGRESHQ